MYRIKGKIDTSNAAEFEKEIMAAKPAEIDASQLEYISSAGLRVLLKLTKAVGDVTVNNVSSEVYEIFEVTGFTEILNVKKAMRKVSVKGLEKIGEGGNGIVYRLDDDKIIKVSKETGNLDALQNELDTSKQAFLSGLPAAIVYDVVETEDGYGQIYEMLNASMMSAVVRENPQDVGKYAREFASLAQQLHSTQYNGKNLKPKKKEYIDAFSQIASYFEENEAAEINRLIDSIPDRNTFIHGDLHMGNIMLQNGEPMLIDLGESGVGHPIFDLAEIYIAYAFSPYSPFMTPERLLATVGMNAELCEAVWKEFIVKYFDCSGHELEHKIRIIKGYAELRLLLITVLMNRSVPESYWKQKVENVRKTLLPRIDELINELDF